MDVYINDVSEVGVMFCYLFSESGDVELICNVLVVADQLLITRLKQLCEWAITGLSKNLNLLFENHLLNLQKFLYNNILLCRDG